MTDERLILAIGRLERALSRIEAAVAAPLPPLEDGDPPPAMAPGLDALEQRHERLRADTKAAMERLTRLLDTGGEG